jgi:hypothetical protein
MAGTLSLDEESFFLESFSIIKKFSFIGAVALQV